MTDKEYQKGDLIYIPQGCTLFDQSELGYFLTNKPALGVLVEKDDHDRCVIFCMGRVLVTHDRQIHRLGQRKDNDHVSQVNRNL